MDEYFCPHCEAILNEQYGFDPACGVWTCTSCGKVLVGDDVYNGDMFEGIAWFCDECGAFLNKQSGFSDSYGSWTCTECGYRNGITEDDIIEDSFSCPNCNATLNEQLGFSKFKDDYECSGCGVKLHHNSSDDEYSIVEEKNGPECPNCGAFLKEQFCFSDYEYDWECTECGTHLHRDYSCDPYEVVDEDAGEDCEEEKEYYNANYASSSYNSGTLEEVLAEPYIKERKRLLEGDLKKLRRKAFWFKKKKVEISFSYIDLLRENVNDVELRLYNQAFNNIKTVPIKDIYKGSNHFEGEVEQVIIAGTSYFNEGDMIPYDAEIVITYHAKKEITIPFSERSLRNMNYIAAGDKLQELGFTEIYEYPIRDLVTGWVKKEGSVEKVTIGEVYPFKKNSVFSYDTRIAIEYHTFKKK